MGRKYKIVLVDDHKLFREGLSFVISQFEDLKIVGEASDGKEFLEIIDELEPDLVLMDISMPNMNGIDATSKALEKYPDLKIVALSMFGDEEYYYKMIQAGVRGFLLKESGKDELETAIWEVLKGENYFSQKLLTNIILNLDKPSTGPARRPGETIKLTRRELEILNLICTGLSNAEIADKLFLSLRTVEGHKSKLINKTGVKNSISLVMYAIKNKLVEV
ncbi:MAG: response regulator transcription factor [Bacteroidetes bacterium]|nr:response regulator transcription factor [Bacteroidota bacterium]